MAKVTLDMETFKALASTTRLNVLRALDERRKTLSELAKELELNKATVHEHLGLLLSTGLVKKRDDEGRKWIYYELTWQGERLLHPQETTTFSVLLGLGIAAAGGGVAFLGAALNWWWAENAGTLEGEESPEQGATPEADRQAMTAEDSDTAGDGAADETGEGTAGASGDSADDAAGDTGMDFFSTEDPDGILAILLFGTAVLLVLLAFAVRRFRRASA